MEEVPGSEESLLAFDEQPALTGQNEEGLLIRLGVVNAALAGLEDGHIDPELRELDRRLAVLVGEPTRRAPRLRREPLGIAHVNDKPTLRDRGKSGASVLKPRFVHAADSRSPSDGCLACASVLSPEAASSRLPSSLAVPSDADPLALARLRFRSMVRSGTIRRGRDGFVVAVAAVVLVAAWTTDDQGKEQFGRSVASRASRYPR